MIKGKTKTGFKFEIDEKVIDDFELIDAIAHADDTSNPAGQMNSISVVCTKLLGAQRNALFEHVRTEDGRVPISAISNELVDIMSAFGKASKNSTSSQE